MSEPLLPPGFRFHPTDEELIVYYLRNRATSVPCPASIIAEVDIYKFDPWDLPAKAMFGDREWYFFSPRDRKYPNGIRPNRAAASGYWKATGTDKPIVTSSGGNANIGVKKALVFYRGKPPRGVKTDWIMHEYRLAESAGNHNKYHLHIPIKSKDASMRLDDWVLCRIYKKSSNHNSCAPTADAEREDSNPEESYLLSAPEPTQHNHHLKMEKSGSYSELFEEADYSMLSRFLCGENPAPDVPGQEQPNMGSVYNIPAAMKQPSLHQGSSQPPTGVPPASGVKRQRAQPEVYPYERGVLLHPSKKYDLSGETVDMVQCNAGYLLNSHLGFR